MRIKALASFPVVRYTSKMLNATVILRTLLLTEIQTMKKFFVAPVYSIALNTVLHEHLNVSCEFERNSGVALSKQIHAFFT